MHLTRAALQRFLMAAPLLAGCGEPASVELTPEQIQKQIAEDKFNADDEEILHQNELKRKKQQQQTP